MTRSRSLLALTLLLLLSGRAWAPPPAQNEAFMRWRVQDKCVADAVTAHPDRTLESLQARDQFVDKCLADRNLPPRAHIAPKPATPPVQPPAGTP